MSRTLDVYLGDRLAGHLTQDVGEQMTFRYVDAWLTAPDAIALSCSLPLREHPFEGKECRGFFAGLLPEAENRELVAKNLGISARNDYSMLEQIGGECAGAVTFIPSGHGLPLREPSYRFLTDEALASVIGELPRRPLLAGDSDIRLSLAGAQDKVALYLADGRLAVPLGGAPSTHILKPAIDRFEGTVYNEYLCMKLAQSVGLRTADVQLGNVDGLDYLLIERYDRISKNGLTERLHQEDYCQALGVAPDNKYQNEGGPSLMQCFELLRKVSTVPVRSLSSLLDAVIFNFLIGNNDAHGKNFSLLYRGKTSSDLTIELAPLYDLLCTEYYPELSKKMAMKIGGEYDSRKVVVRHFERLAEEVGLGKPMVVRRVRTLADAVLAKIPSVTNLDAVGNAVAQQIQERGERVRRLFEADS